MYSAEVHRSYAYSYTLRTRWTRQSAICARRQNQAHLNTALYHMSPSKKVWIVHELKTGRYTNKFATFWMFPERFNRSFVLQVDLRDFEKHENMWIGVKRNDELFL